MIEAMRTAILACAMAAEPHEISAHDGHELSAIDRGHHDFARKDTGANVNQRASAPSRILGPLQYEYWKNSPITCAV